MALGRTYLRVGGYGNGVDVGERGEHRRYPEACLERHITPDGSFCLGLHLRRITNWADAADWWSDLHHFLALQAIAEATGCWPVQHALSHGQEAAGLEIRARRLASRLNIERDYERTIDGEQTWLAKVLQGAPAPATAKRKAMSDLLRLERARREAVEDIWQSQHKSGLTCCGTMKACRLRELEHAVSHASQAA